MLYRLSARAFLLVAALVTISVSGVSQTGFRADIDWPDPDPDVSKYATYDECHAAISRVRSTGKFAPTDTETLPPPRPGSGRGRSIPRVAAIAKECAQKFSVSDVRIADIEPAISLFLTAERKQDADSLVTMLLRSIDLTDTAARIDALKMIINVFMAAQPVLLDDVFYYVEELNQYFDAVTFRGMIPLYGTLLNRSIQTGDSAISETVAGWLRAIPDRLTEDELASRDYMPLSRVVFRGNRYLVANASLDSLAVGSDAYISLQKSLLKRSRAIDPHLGADAPDLRGDFWIPSNPGVKIPAAGKVSLIIFLSHNSCYLKCRSNYATIKRLKQSFPEIDIVISTKTEGYYGHAEPPSPAQEADMISTVWLGYHKLPVIVSVEETAFWKLPNPDRRRVNEPTDNIGNYTQSSPFGAWVYLVDRDGVIIHSAAPQDLRNVENELREMLEVILRP